MKRTLIVLIVGLLAVGCASTPATVESVVGVYEASIGEHTDTLVFSDDGVVEAYYNGKIRAVEGKWKIVERDIHADFPMAHTGVFKINRDGA